MVPAGLNVPAGLYALDAGGPEAPVLGAAEELLLGTPVAPGGEASVPPEGGAPSAESSTRVSSMSTASALVSSVSDDDVKVWSQSHHQHM
jgi:hypothetical protein